MPYDTLSNDKRFRKNTIQIVEEHMAIDQFELVSSFQPAGDQPAAIEALTRGVVEGQSFQTLMGVTGSGKTFTMANVIARVNKPTLILSHNKTLAAQLFGEFKQFFPNNAVPQTWRNDPLTTRVKHRRSVKRNRLRRNR